jgi:tetratricopeptide (TPR) repeat protein
MDDPDIYCCVFRDEHWGLAKRHYDAGGFVAYFGIEGMFNAPAKLSKIFDVRWTYSAYTAHEHRLTPVGIQCLGDGVTEQGCTKANMISAPEEDRIIIGKAMTLEEYLYDCTGLDASAVDVDQLDDDDREEYEAARDVHHPRHCEEMENRASLAMHEHPGHGGRIAYLGYVNGNGNIPIFVRALLTGEKNRTSSLEDLAATAHSRDCIECDNPSCSRPGPTKRCADCATYYCDEACRRAHWQEHMPDCRNVQWMRDGMICLGVVDVPAAAASDDDAEKNRRAMLLATGLDEEERVNLRHMALAELERVVTTDDSRIRIQNLVAKGEVLKELGRHADAIETFSEILRLIEEGIEAKAEGDSLMQQLEEAIAMGMEDIADAIAEMMDTISKKVEYAYMGDAVIEAHLGIAESMEEVGDWDDALEIYIDKVLAVLEYGPYDQPLNFNAVHQRRMFMGMSRCFYHKGDYAKAIGAGEAAIEMNRHFPQVYKYVALSQRAVGDIESSLRTMLRAVHYETPWDDSNKVEVLEMYETMRNDAELSLAERIVENSDEGTDAITPNRGRNQVESLPFNFSINDDIEADENCVASDRSGNHVDDDDNGLPPFGDIDEEEEEEKESLQKYDIDDDDDDAEERELECVASNRPGNHVNNDDDDDDDSDDNDPRPLADIDEKYEEVEEEEDKEKRRSNYPGITVDEFGHTFCSAHRRPWCHICGVSFVERNEETDHNPSDRK